MDLIPLEEYLEQLHDAIERQAADELEARFSIWDNYGILFFGDVFDMIVADLAASPGEHFSGAYEFLRNEMAHFDGTPIVGKPIRKHYRHRPGQESLQVYQRTWSREDYGASADHFDLEGEPSTCYVTFHDYGLPESDNSYLFVATMLEDFGRYILRRDVKAKSDSRYIELGFVHLPQSP